MNYLRREEKKNRTSKRLSKACKRAWKIRKKNMVKKPVEIKSCGFCGNFFKRNKKYSKKQWKDARFCSGHCRALSIKSWENLKNHQFKKGHIVPKEWRIKISKANWKGGNSRNKNVLDGVRYKEWRKAVFERDNYTCLLCGYRGNKLVAHHIRSWSKFPKFRFNIRNGITLCNCCHRNDICICPKYRKEYGLEHHFVIKGLKT